MYFGDLVPLKISGPSVIWHCACPASEVHVAIMLVVLMVGS